MNHVAVVVDTVSVNPFVLVVPLNGRLLDFVDPRLLNFHLCPAEMNVELFAHVISICHPFLSDFFVQLMVVVHLMVIHDSYLRIVHLISHQLLEFPLVDLVVPVELEREDMFAHVI